MIGTVKRMLLGTEYLLLIKFAVNIKLSTGEITGVCVDSICILVDCGDAKGYVPNVKPMRFANGCPKLKLGV